ncbi:LPXTG cell wall anchor domain-containing protein [Streptococcus equi]|uniref:LPXTG cell wall anchor domain-containing protein n=1 Tax=Streptococcus equi TaxID=1336 RepID=UPI0005C2FAB4|nr:collagen-like cell surface-anchored protein SclF [Streptococcus equi subsp. zooepidemicus SzAM35]
MNRKKHTKLIRNYSICSAVAVLAAVSLGTGQQVQASDSNPYPNAQEYLNDHKGDVNNLSQGLQLYFGRLKEYIESELKNGKQGPAGPAGPAGPRGERGPKGERGEQSPKKEPEKDTKPSLPKAPDNMPAPKAPEKKNPKAPAPKSAPKASLPSTGDTSQSFVAAALGLIASAGLLVFKRKKN